MRATNADPCANYISRVSSHSPPIWFDILSALIPLRLLESYSTNEQSHYIAYSLALTSSYTAPFLRASLPLYCVFTSIPAFLAGAQSLVPALRFLLPRSLKRAFFLLACFLLKQFCGPQPTAFKRASPLSRFSSLELYKYFCIRSSYSPLCLRALFRFASFFFRFFAGLFLLRFSSSSLIAFLLF